MLRALRAPACRSETICAPGGLRDGVDIGGAVLPQQCAAIAANARPSGSGAGAGRHGVGSAGGGQRLHGRHRAGRRAPVVARPAHRRRCACLSEPRPGSELRPLDGHPRRASRHRQLRGRRQLGGPAVAVGDGSRCLPRSRGSALWAALAEPVFERASPRLVRAVCNRCTPAVRRPHAGPVPDATRLSVRRGLSLRRAALLELDARGFAPRWSGAAAVPPGGWAKTPSCAMRSRRPAGLCGTSPRLRLRHYMPAGRLTLAYARRLSFEMGRAAARLEPTRPPTGWRQHAAPPATGRRALVRAALGSSSHAATRSRIPSPGGELSPRTSGAGVALGLAGLKIAQRSRGQGVAARASASRQTRCPIARRPPRPNCARFVVTGRGWLFQ